LLLLEVCAREQTGNIQTDCPTGICGDIHGLATLLSEQPLHSQKGTKMELTPLEIQEMVEAIAVGPSFVFSRDAEDDKQNHREMAALSLQ